MMSDKTLEWGVTKIVENQTAGAALEAMRSEGTRVLLIVDGDRKQPKALLSEAELKQAEPDSLLREVARYAAPLSDSVRAPYVLDDVVRRHSGYLERWPNLPGLLVTYDEGFRVLPREVVTKGASQVVTRGMNEGRLEGAPLDVLFYECPIDHERKLVAYYDPRNPPRCRLGHDMAPVED
jgi:hypothetical protein